MASATIKPQGGLSRGIPNGGQDGLCNRQVAGLGVRYIRYETQNRSPRPSDRPLRPTASYPRFISATSPQISRDLYSPLQLKNINQHTPTNTNNVRPARDRYTRHVRYTT